MRGMSIVLTSLFAIFLSGCTVLQSEYLERRELIINEVTRELDDPDINRDVVDRVLRAVEKRIFDEE